jgi:hypothetical protein
VNDRDIYRAANPLIKQHGAKTIEVAAGRAADLALQGEQKGPAALALAPGRPRMSTESFAQPTAIWCRTCALSARLR